MIFFCLVGLTLFSFPESRNLEKLLLHPSVFFRFLAFNPHTKKNFSIANVFPQLSLNQSAHNIYTTHSIPLGKVREKGRESLLWTRYSYTDGNKKGASRGARVSSQRASKAPASKLASVGERSAENGCLLQHRSRHLRDGLWKRISFNAIIFIYLLRNKLTLRQHDPRALITLNKKEKSLNLTSNIRFLYLL